MDKAHECDGCYDCEFTVSAKMRVHKADALDFAKELRDYLYGHATALKDIDIEVSK